MSSASLMSGTTPVLCYPSAGGGGSAADWSQYPATQTVEMDGNELKDPRKITLRQSTGGIKPSLTMVNGSTQSTLWRSEGDTTVRINNGNVLEASGYVLDTLLNPPTLGLTGGSFLELSAVTAGPTGPTGTVLSSVDLSSVVGQTGPQGPQGPTGPPSVVAFASLSATNTQLVSAANTPTKVNFNVEDIDQGGFSLSSGSVVVPLAGSYEIIPSLIFTRAGGNLATAYFWIQVNGVDVPNSGTQITMSGNGEHQCPCAAVITASLNAGDSVAVYFASSDASVQIDATPSQTLPYVRPLTPAAIMTVKLLQTSAVATSVDVALQNKLQIVPVGTPTPSVVKYTGVGGVGTPSSWVPDQQPPIAGGTNNGWRFTKAVGSPNTAKINWYPFNPYYPAAPSVGVPPSVLIKKKNLEALWFVISTQNNINVQGLLYLQIYTYDYVNGSSTFYTNRWDYVSPLYSGAGAVAGAVAPYTLKGGFKYLVCAVDGINNAANPVTSTTLTYANGQFPSQRTTTKLRDPYDIHTDIPHLTFNNVGFVNTPTPQPADPSDLYISAFAVNTSSATVTTALDFTIEKVGYKSGGINYEYTLEYS